MAPVLKGPQPEMWARRQGAILTAVLGAFPEGRE